MSEIAFNDFSNQIMNLSYEQTVILIKKLFESLKDKKNETSEELQQIERIVSNSAMSIMWEELKDDQW